MTTFCNGCTACCRGDHIHLLPGDDPSKFETVERDGKLWLRQADGECVYLAEGGCSIYDRQPIMCRRFNCVDYFRQKTRTQRRLLEKQRPEHFGPIFAAARQRLRSAT